MVQERPLRLQVASRSHHVSLRTAPLGVAQWIRSSSSKNFTFFSLCTLRELYSSPQSLSDWRNFDGCPIFHVSLECVSELTSHFPGRKFIHDLCLSSAYEPTTDPCKDSSLNALNEQSFPWQLVKSFFKIQVDVKTCHHCCCLLQVTKSHPHSARSLSFDWGLRSSALIFSSPVMTSAFFARCRTHCHSGRVVTFSKEPMLNITSSTLVTMQSASLPLAVPLSQSMSGRLKPPISRLFCQQSSLPLPTLWVRWEPVHLSILPLASRLKQRFSLQN